MIVTNPIFYENSFRERLNKTSKSLSTILGRYSRAGAYAFITDKDFTEALSVASIPAQILIDNDAKVKVFNKLKNNGISSTSLKPERVLMLHYKYSSGDMTVLVEDVRQSRGVCDAWSYYIDNL